MRTLGYHDDRLEVIDSESLAHIRQHRELILQLDEVVGNLPATVSQYPNLLY
jgi:hypothetical protein